MGPTMKKTSRVLIAKVGLDGHDRGAKLIARGLRDAGEDVLFTGLRQTVQGLTETAVREKVGILGLSFLAGDHMTLVPKVLEALREAGAGEIPVIVGGIISEKEAEQLLQMGIDKVFFPGTPLAEIVTYFQELAASLPAREAEPPTPLPGAG